MGEGAWHKKSTSLLGSSLSLSLTSVERNEVIILVSEVPPVNTGKKLFCGIRYIRHTQEGGGIGGRVYPGGGNRRRGFIQEGGIGREGLPRSGG